MHSETLSKNDENYESYKEIFYQSEAGWLKAATCGAPGWKRVREPSYTPTQK